MKKEVVKNDELNMDEWLLLFFSFAPVEIDLSCYFKGSCILL